MSESNFTRDKQNPIALISRFWPSADISHITYDPTLGIRKGQYEIVEQAQHDGTLIFTYTMLQKLLLPLVNQSIVHKSQISEGVTILGIKYTIGSIAHSIVYGRVKLACGVYPGLRERVRIPVISIIKVEE